MDCNELIAFETDIADLFNKGDIRSPVHLSGGNEEQLIAYFEENFKEGDWIATAWRSHYHCLLAGVPPEKLKKAILAGRSITLCFPEHQVISSAIVGGILPIATGIALCIKRSEDPVLSKVHCFVGDMTARTGAFWENIQYAHGHNLPIRYIIEDNRKSVGTPTAEVWGRDLIPRNDHVTYYQYDLKYPHAGAGKWIRF